MKFEQGLFKSSLYDFKKLLWKDELNPRVRCAFGNVLLSSWLCLPYRDINRHYHGDHLGALLSLLDRLLDADNLAILKGDQGLHLGILSLGLVDLEG